MADGHLIFDTKIATKGFEKGLDTIESSIDSLKGSVLKLSAAFGLAFSGKEAIEAAASMNAAASQFEQTFGAFQDSAKAAIDSVAQSSGILEKRLQSTATSIYAFAKTSGMDSPQALDMMSQALQVAADSAAYYDRSLEETSETLKSFLKGNYANDAALGLSSTEATRNAKAMELYGEKFTDLSEAQKQLTLLQMVKDANALSGAQGQAAREAEGWENVIGNLKQAWKELMAAVGQPLLALAVPIVQSLTSALTRLTEIANAAAAALSKVFGFTLGSSKSSAALSDNAEKAAESYEQMSEAAEAANEANENSLASFDQINKLGDDKEESTSANTVNTPASVPPLTLNTTPANAQLDAFLSQTKAKLAELVNTVRTAFNTAAGYIRSNFGTIFLGIWEGLKAEGVELLGILSGVAADLTTLYEPLKDYFTNDLTPYLQTVFTTLGDIAIGLFDTFNMVFSDIWSIAVFPILQNFVTTGLPLITQFAGESWTTFGTLFDSVKELFDMIWQDVVRPVLGFIAQLWQDTWELLKGFWDDWGKPIFDRIREAIQSTKDVLVTAWQEFLKPVFDNLMQMLDRIWTDHIKPLVAEFLDFVGVLITGALDIYNKFIAPIIKALIQDLGPIVSKVINTAVNIIGNAVGSIIDAAKGIITALKGIIQFITGVFTGDWEKAWKGIKNFFKGIWDAFYNIVKIPINLIIGAINTMTQAFEDAINWIIDGVNTLSFDVPDWVPGIGGETFGFSLDYIDVPEIPKLAAGTVIPANYGEFLAVLGDNKREAEVVSPLSTIKQAVMEALVALDGTGRPDSSRPMIVQVVLDGKVVGQTSVNYINDQTKANGISPLKT